MLINVSEYNLILFVLNKVIRKCRPLIMSVLHDGPHVMSSLKLVLTSLVSFHAEPLLQGLQRDLFETREP